jgi:uncharacterized protein YecT (DUF1311 family)
MKIQNRMLIAGFLLLGASGAAFADDAYDKCVDAGSTNTAWGECGGAFMKREDDKLNATWKRVYALTSDQTKTDLLDEQRAWVKFRESACKFYANGERGREGQVLSYPACVAGVISDRTKALEAYEEEFKPI